MVGKVKCLFNRNSRDISGFGDAPAYQYFNMIHLYEQNTTKRATMISTFCLCTPETFQSLSNTEQPQNSQSGTLFTLLVHVPLCKLNYLNSSLAIKEFSCFGAREYRMTQ